jgi:hypothetical protein
LRYYNSHLAFGSKKYDLKGPQIPSNEEAFTERVDKQAAMCVLELNHATWCILLQSLSLSRILRPFAETPLFAVYKSSFKV